MAFSQTVSKLAGGSRGFNRFECVDYGVARKISILVAAHTIGHCPDSGFRPGQIAIFVSGPYQADVCRGSGLKQGLRLSHDEILRSLYLTAESILPVSMLVNSIGSGICRQQNPIGL